MSADSELLIKIKTILESQGIDAAKAKIDELTKTTNASGLSEAAANLQRSKSEIQAEKSARAAIALNGALQGGMGPFRAAIHVANQFGGTLASLAFKITAISSVFAIGFKIGTAIGEKISGTKAAEEELKKIGTESDNLRKRISDLNEIKLNAIRKEAESLAKDFSTAVDKAERLKRLGDLREDTKLASDLAGLNLRFQKGEINQNERDRQEIQYTHESEMRKLQSEETRINTEQSLSDRRKSEKVQTWKTLSGNYGSADRSFNDGIQGVKGLGFKNPEDFASSGSLSEADTTLLEQFRKKVKEQEQQLKWFSEHGMPKQAAIHADMLAEAKKPEEMLNNLRELKVQKDLARHTFEEFKGINNTGLTKTGELAPYRKTMDEEAIRQEQLDADKDVLVGKYQQKRAIKESGLTGVQNRITKDFDESVNENQSPQLKARKKGSELLDSITLDFQTKRDNAGLPLSSAGQKQFDSDRLTEAAGLAKVAVNKAYNGGDPNAVLSELLDALRQIAARPVLREDQIQAILTDIRNLKGQQQTSPGLN